MVAASPVAKIRMIGWQQQDRKAGHPSAICEQIYYDPAFPEL